MDNRDALEVALHRAEGFITQLKEENQKLRDVGKLVEVMRIMLAKIIVRSYSYW